jgi:hypothetical protein
VQPRRRLAGNACRPWLRPREPNSSAPTANGLRLVIQTGFALNWTVLGLLFDVGFQNARGVAIFLLNPRWRRTWMWCTPAYCRWLTVSGGTGLFEPAEGARGTRALVADWKQPARAQPRVQACGDPSATVIPGGSVPAYSGPGWKTGRCLTLDAPRCVWTIGTRETGGSRIYAS